MASFSLPAARGVKRINNHYSIEGENVTNKDIAERIGISVTNVDTRLRRLRKEPGAITWAKLRGDKK